MAVSKQNKPLLLRIIYGIAMALTVALLLLYLPACLAYCISPAQWWPMGILSIGFPYLWLAVLAAAAFWFFLHKKTALVLMVALVLGLPVAWPIMGWRREALPVQKLPQQIRVMQWNCEGLMGSAVSALQQEERKKTIAFLKQYNPDVICLQDFKDYQHPQLNSNVSLLRDSLGYRYVHFDGYYYLEQWGAKVYDGIAIFSRLPFKNKGSEPYDGKLFPEAIIWADIQAGDKTLRVMTTHFQSMHLYQRMGPDVKLNYYQWQDSSVIYSDDMLQKLRYFQSYHVQQAVQLRRAMDSSKSPLVFAADLNSVPSSWAYHCIKGNMQDAFVKKGLGWGGSYHCGFPNIRIDYLLASPDITIQKYKQFNVSFSDHDPLIMDISLSPQQGQNP